MMTSKRICAKYGLPKPLPNQDQSNDEQDWKKWRGGMRVAMQRCNRLAVVHRVADKVENGSSHGLPRQRLPRLVERQRPCKIPTPVTMDGDVKHAHMLLGRCFKVSQLMFPVLKCACCGVVRPFHDDLEFLDKTGQLIQRHHLTVEPKDAYHCTCDHCHGSQFWPTGRSAIMRAFRDAHGVSQRRRPNCTICLDCANKAKTSDNGLVCAFSPLHSLCCLSVLNSGTAHFCALPTALYCLTHTLSQLFAWDSGTPGAMARVLCPSTATLLPHRRMAQDLTPLSTGRPVGLVTFLTSSHMWKKRPFGRLSLSFTSLVSLMTACG